MPTKRIGDREFEIGVLQPDTVTLYPGPTGAYYSMLMGKNPAGETRSLITRGAGKQWGATRVPLQISAEAADSVRRQGLLPSGSYDDLRRNLVLAECVHDMNVLLVQMPREGNFVSGWEWNAPDGTQQVGEAPQDIATREFSEECDLVPLWTGTDFPEWNQYASGCYDEVQLLSLALVTGNPTKLVEGARQWVSIPLDNFKVWSHAQNQRRDHSLWQTGEFCPVDGKIYGLVRSFWNDLLMAESSKVLRDATGGWY